MRELTRIERLHTGLMTLKQYNNDASIQVVDGWVNVYLEIASVNDSDRRWLSECQWVYSVPNKCWSFHCG